MTSDILKRLGFMVLLVMLQVLVLNHIQLFNIATPLLIIMLPLHFDSEQPRWSAMLWCFCTGLMTDIFSNTPGVAAGSMTLIGLIQPMVVKLFVPEKDEVFRPTLKNMGWMKYIAYSLFLILVFCLAFFTLEAFSFFNPIVWIESIGYSTLLTFAIVLAIEKIRGV